MSHRAPRSALVGLVLGTLITLVAAAAPPPTNAVTMLRPDLRMASLRDFVAVRTSTGRRLLRFTTVMVNVGAGPFEVRGRRETTSERLMTTKQRIYDTLGNSHWVATGGLMSYAGDGHDHWHIRRIQLSELFRKGDTVTPPRRSAKIGFCFFDTNPYRLTLPRAPDFPVYRESSCGTRSSLRAWMGLSVGWSDKYPWNFAFQYIDVTGLPAGVYRVCTTVDPQGFYTETNDTNNHVWADVRLVSGSSTVSLVDRGWSRCRPLPRDP